VIARTIAAQAIAGKGRDNMTIRKVFLIAVSAALLPVAAEGLAGQPAASAAPDQAAPAQAAAQPASAAAAPPAATEPPATRDYPPCSAKVTDSCTQGGGRSRGKAHHGKASHHKKS
jgi:hypothetical protein